jgi:hypothetical protein
VRIINLESTLHKLLPLLEARLTQSRFAGWQGSLALDGGLHKAVLHIQQGRVEIARPAASENILHAGPDLARFLIGSDEPDELIRQAEMDCTGLALPLVRVLFPNLHPMLSHWDEY